MSDLKQHLESLVEALSLARERDEKLTAEIEEAAGELTRERTAVRKQAEALYEAIGAAAVALHESTGERYMVGKNVEIVKSTELDYDDVTAIEWLARKELFGFLKLSKRDFERMARGFFPSDSRSGALKPDPTSPIPVVPVTGPKANVAGSITLEDRRWMSPEAANELIAKTASVIGQHKSAGDKAPDQPGAAESSIDSEATAS